MPLDPSIPLQFRPPQIEDPLNAFARAQAARGAMMQNEAARLQMDESRAAAEVRNRFAADMQAAGGDPRQVRNVLMRYGRVKEAMEMDKGSADTEKTRAETAAKWVATYRDALVGVNDPQSFAAWRQALVKDLPQMDGIVPQQFSPEIKQGLIMQASELVERLSPKGVQIDRGGTTGLANPYTGEQIGNAFTKTPTPDAMMTDARARAEGAANRAVTTRGQDLADQRAREAAAREGATEKPLTEAQGKSTGFAIRARESADILNELERGGTFGRVAGVKEATRESFDRVPLVGTALSNVAGAVGNVVTSAAQQRYEQAKRDFVNAVLRVESGAVIADDEFRNADRQYFPQAGDSDRVIAQKRANREKAIEAIMAQAGPGTKKVPATRAPVDAKGGWTIKRIN